MRVYYQSFTESFHRADCPRCYGYGAVVLHPSFFQVDRTRSIREAAQRVRSLGPLAYAGTPGVYDSCRACGTDHNPQLYCGEV